MDPDARETSFSSAPSFSEVNEKALIRRIDGRLIPILFLVYVAAFLDRWVL